jgi:hypothetical protein
MPTVHQPTVSDEPGTDTTLYFDRLIALEKARRGIPPQPRAA